MAIRRVYSSMFACDVHSYNQQDEESPAKQEISSGYHCPLDPREFHSIRGNFEKENEERKIR